MRGPERGGKVHMVCPKLLEQDERHGHHLAFHRHPLNNEPGHQHDRKCGCLIDWEGHRATSITFQPGAEIADNHPDLVCACGSRLVVGEWL